MGPLPSELDSRAILSFAAPSRKSAGRFALFGKPGSTAGNIANMGFIRSSPWRRIWGGVGQNRRAETGAEVRSSQTLDTRRLDVFGPHDEGQRPRGSKSSRTGGLI